MEEKLQKILEDSGVTTKRDDSSSGGVLRQFEAWLGLDEYYNGLTIEDCKPIPSTTFRELGEIFAGAWRPQDEEDLSSWRRNLLLESNLSPQKIQLQDVWDSILVTKWAHFLIDLHVDDTVSTSYRFMQSGDDSLTRLLVSTLYHHINVLPILQSHMHQYKQYLQRRTNLDRAGGGGGDLLHRTWALFSGGAG